MPEQKLRWSSWKGTARISHFAGRAVLSHRAVAAAPSANTASPVASGAAATASAAAAVLARGFSEY